ncbi:DUF3445 domain-containing protein [Rhodobacterales bacterium]|nr:DUF3445 domain-containing protein [Rhodobacterales bacterium]
MNSKSSTAPEGRPGLEARGEPPFAHTPYDGTSQPFSVGLKPIGEELFLEPDRYLRRYLQEKEKLFEAAFEKVFQAEDGTGAAQEDVLALVLDNLRRYHGGTYTISPEQVDIAGLDHPILLDGQPALLTASRLVQEDLVLMRLGVDGYRLAAASLCFPSSWSLMEKFGKSMSAIHESVPGFNGGRMGTTVARIFVNLKPGHLVCRFNWSLYDDPDLYHPQSRRIHLGSPTNIAPRLFLRVERQTLRRLEETGDILFTIKVHHDPLALLEQHPERGRLAAGLRDQLMALDGEQLDYKGITHLRDDLARSLEAMTE